MTDTIILDTLIDAELDARRHPARTPAELREDAYRGERWQDSLGDPQPDGWWPELSATHSDGPARSSYPVLPKDRTRSSRSRRPRSSGPK